MKTSGLCNNVSEILYTNWTNECSISLRSTCALLITNVFMMHFVFVIMKTTHCLILLIYFQEMFQSPRQVWTCLLVVPQVGNWRLSLLQVTIPTMLLKASWYGLTFLTLFQEELILLYLWYLVIFCSLRDFSMPLIFLLIINTLIQFQSRKIQFATVLGSHHFNLKLCLPNLSPNTGSVQFDQESSLEV